MSGLGLSAGVVIGRDFRIVHHLASGAMGSVYVVEQLSTGKQRALKVMSLELANNDRARERFVLEARVGANIESDHVVEVVTAGIDEETGAPYLVMELLRGEELADKIVREGRLELAQVAEILKQAGHALGQAHAQGVVHRDIKPENLFIAESRREGVPFTVKILDFGIAKLVAERTQEGTQPIGTPLFMAPEQTDRRGLMSPAADVWPLGLIAFQLLVGRHYWLAAEQGITTLLREIVMEALPPATARAHELGGDGLLPAGFDAWFERCVNRDPRLRWQEAGACVRAFCALAPGMASGPVAPIVAVSTPGLGDAVTAQMSGPGLAGFGPGMGRAQLTAQAGTGPQLPGNTGPGWSGSNATGPQLPGGNTGPGMSVPGQTAAGTGLTASASLATPPTSSSSKTGLILGGLAAVAVIGAGLFFVSRGSDPSAPVPAASAPASAPASAAPAAPPPISCPEGMVELAGGAMFMGSTDEDLGEDVRPPHKVKVSKFCFDKNEVTVEQMTACVNGGHCLRPKPKVAYPGAKEEEIAAFSALCNYGQGDKKDHPMNCVSWSTAQQFCESEGGRLEPGGARLPTEAEWEFAARGSGQRVYPWGDEEPGPKRLNACGTECSKWLQTVKLKDYGRMFDADDGHPATAPVGSYPAGASTAGVLDLAGNVWEWTADWYGPYVDDEQADPKGPQSGKTRVVRGGGFNGLKPAWAKPAYRWHTVPSTTSHGIGFRCAKTFE